MHNKRIIILDFDGTLADTASVIIQTMQATISELGLPTRTDEQCSAMIGLRLIEIPPVLFPECDLDAELYATTYRRLFHIYNTEDAVVLYPGVIDTLTELKKRGFTLTIASSRSHRSLVEFIESMNLQEVLTFVLGADDVIQAKPHPEPVLRTLEKFGCQASEALVVGDTAYDIEMGRRAGARTCGVTYGNGSRAELARAGADFLIDDFGELLDIV